MTVMRACTIARLSTLAALLVAALARAQSPSEAPAASNFVLQLRFSPAGHVQSLLFSPDARWLAVHGSYNDQLYFTQLWAMDDRNRLAGQRVQVMGGGAPWAFSPDSGLFATTWSPHGAY